MQSNLKYNTTHQLPILVKNLLQEWWWVVLFLLVSYFTLDQIRDDIQKEQVKLTEKVVELTHEKEDALQENTELKLCIQSQADPEWIQLTLKKHLGVVPDGQTKVHFKD